MNIVHRLSQMAKTFPNKLAVYFPIKNKKHLPQNHEYYHYDSITFKELESLSSKFANQLVDMGVKKGDRTLLFLRPSLSFHAMVFALFKVGAVPIFIDPGMGRKNLIKCIKESAPILLIAEKEIYYLKLFMPQTFKSIRLTIFNGFTFSFGKNAKTIKKMCAEKNQSFAPVEFSPDEMAAVLFTSGGTGAPKGVVYTHSIFENQTDLLKEMFKLTPDDIDLPGFPLFSLFTLAMGMSTCIPDMNPAHPGQCHPEKIYQNIVDRKCTFLAGSPAIWERVADYCLKNGLTLPHVRVIAMFGAPVSLDLHRKLKLILPAGTTYTPYGATECLPVTNISGLDILANTAEKNQKGKGTCIGLPVPGIKIKIIPISDQSIDLLSHTRTCAPFEVGEIIVQGKVATREYLELPQETVLAKIYEDSPDQSHFWHRMGDLGYFDQEGMLWFLGRKSHRVEINTDVTLCPIPCEAIFNQHPAVRRSALVGLGTYPKQTPAIVIERKDGEYLQGKERAIFESELLALAQKYSHTQVIQKIYLSRSFPVDVRHNIKIDRLKLKKEIENYENHES